MNVVLDASAVINTDSLDVIEAYTTPSVMKELKTLGARSLMDIIQIQNKLSIREPKESYLKKVREKAREVGSLRKLSETDLGVLALALEKSGEIYTDDYTLQNVAAHLDLKYRGVMRGEIKHKKRFKQAKKK